jgi:hypothetical protein
MSAVDLDAGVIVMPKKLSIGVAIAVAAQLVVSVYWFANAQATTNSQIDQLKSDGRRDAGAIAEINGRTLQMAIDVAYIRATVDSFKKR